MPVLAKDFISGIGQVDRNSFASEAERLEAKNAAAKLVQDLETPWETTFRYTWSTISLQAALRTAVSMELFTKWNEAGGGTKTSADLASMVGCDIELLERLLRHMAAMYAIQQIKEDTYAPTAFSTALGKPGYLHCMQYLYDVQMPGDLNLFSFLKDTNYQDPSDPTHTNWHHYLKGEKSFFDWLGQFPNVAQDFSEVMKIYSSSKVPWVNVYPTDRLVKQQKPGHAVVVDVGGGLGHDLELFRAKYPNLPANSLVLQDLNHQIIHAKDIVKAPVQAVEHDFFTPQPVKAAAYFLHKVLHDWPDDKAKEILVNLTSAMEKGYSKVLLYESVIGRGTLHPHVTSSDLTMMMAFSARERTQAKWEKLLSSAGLKLVQVWDYPAAQESIIEAELA